MGKRSRLKRERRREAPVPDAVSSIPPEKSLSRKTVLLASLLIVAAAAAVYWVSFSSPFQFDDQRTVVGNLSIRYLGHWGAMFRFAPSRFLLTLSFALDYRIWGLNPLGYHLTNTAIHATNAVLIFLILSSGILAKKDRLLPLALGAALLFALHPLNTEAVTYISARSSSLSALFFLLAFYFYRRSRASHARIFYGLALGVFMAGLMVKEVMAMLPFVLLFYEFSEGKDSAVSRIRCRWKALLPFFLIPALGLFARIAVAGFHVSHLPRSLATQVLSECRVLFLNLRLFLFPFGLTIDHSTAQASVGDGTALPAFLSWCALLGAAWIFRRKASLLSFAVFWVFLSYLPIMLIPLNDLMMEHWSYLSNIGWLLAAVWAVEKACEKKGSLFLRSAAVAGMILLCAFGTLSYRRNRVWRTPISLWSDAARKAPEKGRPWVNLAAAYFIRKDYDQALACYQKAADRPGAYLPRVYLGMGRIYFEQKRNLEEAEKYFKLALRIDPRLWDAYARLGYLYRERGDCKTALSYMEKARERGRENELLQFMLGDCYYRTNRLDEAKSTLLWVLELKPGDFFAELRLGQLFEKKTEWGQALHYYREARRTRPDDPVLARRIQFVQSRLLKKP